MKKYILGLVIVIGVVFIGSGSFMAFQGFNAQMDVRNSVAAEKVKLGVAEKPDGTKDEVVAKFVPTEYQGMALADVGKPEALLWQRDVIRGHTLASTKGKVFAEMPKNIQKLDESGNPVVDQDGKPVMVTNTARDIWTQSTTLQSALLQGYMAWKLSELVMGIGALFVFVGLMVFALSIPLRKRL